MGRNRIEWYSNERDNIRRIHLSVTYKSHDVVDEIEMSWEKILISLFALSRASSSSYENMSLEFGEMEHSKNVLHQTIGFCVTFNSKTRDNRVIIAVVPKKIPCNSMNDSLRILYDINAIND